METEVAAEQLRDDLLSMLAAGRAAEAELFAALDPAQRESAPAGEWSPKDVVAHLAAWRDRQVERIARRSRGEPAESTENVPIDTTNARLHEERAEWSWKQAVAEAEASATRLSEAVRTLEPELFQDSDLIGGVMGNGPNHDLEHLPAIGRLTGKEAPADELAQQISVTVQAGSFSDFDAGTMVYNVACFATRDGRLGAARPLLRRAFALRADLRDFAKEDPDLLELRGELAQLTSA
jgi:hypothetical protein